jgi:DNA-binding response OmpR family regulator
MERAASVLVVDDDPTVSDVVRRYLERDGYLVTLVGDGPAALASFARHRPDLVVLDLMLPGMDGLEICRRVRAESDVPIIMLTARSDDIDKIVGLELGADDYLTKPFNPRELVARVKAILRRQSAADRRSANTPDAGTLTLSNLVIDPERRSVRIDGRAIDLRMKEFDLLFTLAKDPGLVFSREKLLEVVWGYDFAGETRTVDVHIAHLRHKLEGMAPTIETVWGVGYKLEVE